MRSRKSNLPARIARAIIFVAAFSFSVCFSFKQNRAEEKCATFFAESRVLSSSLFLKKNWFFSSLVCRNFCLWLPPPPPPPLVVPSSLEKTRKKKKYRPKKPARFDRTKRCPRTTTRGKKRLLCCKLSSHSAGVFFLLLSSARVYSSLYAREREREREKSGETRRSRARKISLSSKNLLFSLSKAPKSPPPKEKGRKREEIQNKFSFKERKKERYDGAVLTINQRQSEDIVSRYRFFFI